MDFTHLNEEGRARMVDITQKNETNRVAVITAVSIALLTIYDMCKAVDRWMEIVEIKLLEKNGGKSGHVLRGENS